MRSSLFLDVTHLRLLIEDYLTFEDRTDTLSLNVGNLTTNLSYVTSQKSEDLMEVVALYDFAKVSTNTEPD
jgi:NADH/NAD ratio-sensing transcriptional regulator Rex